MSRAFTLFTGQWADLPLEDVCRLAHQWGYDGLELACWGDHFEVDRALREDGYLAGARPRWLRSCAAGPSPTTWSGGRSGDHPIDVRHPGHPAPPGSGATASPEGFGRRAAAELADTARAAAAFGWRPWCLTGS